MKNSPKHLFVSCLLAAAVASGSSLYAAESKPKAPDKPASSPKAAAETTAKREWYPFGGIVASVDKQADTISLKKKEGERVLKLDAKSELEINGKSAVLGSVKTGDYAHGTLHKDKDGKEVITAAKFDKEAPSRHADVTPKKPSAVPSPKVTK